MFRSSSQNSEDLRAWIASGKIVDGFYVEVGANDPFTESATYGLYTAGWRGILVEPIPELAQLLRIQRPGDVVVEAAAWDETGSADLTIPLGERLGWARVGANLPSQSQADRQRNRVLSVATRRMDTIFEEEMVEGIDFMSIDVEGCAANVLAGTTLTRWAPKVLCIEKGHYTDWTSEKGQSNFAEWEPLVLSGGYQFRFDDGINRWYAHERAIIDSRAFVDLGREEEFRLVLQDG